MTLFDDNFLMTIFYDNFLMTIFDDIETIFDNWKDSPGDLTFETLITFLIIENLNSDNNSYLTVNCDTGQHSQFLLKTQQPLILEKFQIFGKISNFQIFGKKSDFLENFRFLEKFQNFGKISDFRKNFRSLEKIQIFGKFLEFWFLAVPRELNR